MAKIYDCFMFFNELDLLELRLETLYPYVDKFVISESDSTHSGMDKPFLFEQNREKYSKYEDKLIYIKNHNSKEVVSLQNPYTGKKGEVFDVIVGIHDNHKPEHGHGQPQWCRQFIQQEYVKLGMAECEDDDIIMFSDLDEIPNPETIENIKDWDMSKQYCLLQDNNNYYVNSIASTNWRGNIVCSYNHVKDKSLGLMRHSARQPVNDFSFIENAGWHFSYMLPLERTIIKIKSCAHQEFNNPRTINSVEHNLKTNRDPLGRPSSQGYNTYGNQVAVEEFYFDDLKNVDVAGYLPENMITLIEEKFPYLLKR